MIKFVTTAAVLGTLSAGIFVSPPTARAAVTVDPAMTAACWNQVRQRDHMPGYGTDAGMDRKREYLFDACIQNGGRIP